ncbi:MAG: aminopeptidase [Elusimicrobia bacterium]|nr:aminopeptidase [Elusimicrobiota bacterium]
MRPDTLVVLFAVLLCGCSPVYVTKAAAGHASLLWHSRGMESALRDPKTPQDLKAKLQFALDVRAFAFERMGLRKTKDYSTYSPVRGAVTYVVSACPKTSLTPYQWWFPFLGKVPYKGYFHKADALKEMKRMEDLGFDTRVGGVAAYKTPLPFRDPLPSSTLDYLPGDLADLLIHELFHGTVWFKDQVEFDEAAATFAGQEGAKEFLAWRYGADSPQLKDYLDGLSRQSRFAGVMEDLYKELGELYGGKVGETEKLNGRDSVFSKGEQRLKEIGQPISEKLNNAVVLAHRLYIRDLSPFKALYERNGKDWRKTIAALKALDRKDPFAALSKG